MDFIILLQAVGTIAITVLIIKLFRQIWIRFGKDTIHAKFIKNVITAVIWMAGIVFALSWFPQFTYVATALIAGSGIVALVIGLAAQESMSNAFNGMFLTIFKPFEVGDRVHLVNANITGFVEDITIRHTVIRTFVNSRIIIPNSVINQELIENSNFCGAHASSFIDVTVVYGTDIDTAKEIMARVIGEHKDFVDNRTDEQKETAPKVPVFVRTLGLFGVELRASMWTESIGINFAACSDVRRTILEEFENAGVKLATSMAIVQTP